MNPPVTRFLIVLSIAFAASTALAAAPGLMNYQGILTDAGGAVVVDGDYSVTFAIYADSSGGTPLWSETRTVPVADGLFNELLGSVNTLTPALFAATPRWMGITVGGDPEMTPRMKIGSVPWALRAAVADSAVATGGGGDGHSLDADDGDPEDVVYVNQWGQVGVGTTEPTRDLHIKREISNPIMLVVENPSTGTNASSHIGLWTQDEAWGYVESYSPLHSTSPGLMRIGKHGPGAHMSFSLNNTECIRIDTVYNVGIGKWAPEYKLDVAGTVNVDGFRMTIGSVEGRVLTSDSDGNGTWQAPVAGSDGDWTVSGDDMYSGVSGNVGIGTASPLHHLHVVGSDTLGSLMIAPALDVNESSELRLAEDDDGTFGAILRYNGSLNLFELGGWAGSAEYGPHMTVARNYPIFEFDGTAGTIQFDLDATGNSSVILPNDAVGASEILDEPGVADTTWTGVSQLFTTSPITLLSRSITCPATGYVLAVATAHIQNFVSGTEAQDCDFALSDQEAVMPTTHFGLAFPGHLGAGNYDTPLTIHELFPVAGEGTYTYYLLADESLGQYRVYDKKMTLVYIPTAYGNVTAAARESGGQAAIDPAVAAERAETAARNVERIEREMAELRDEVEALREKMRSEDDR